MKKELKIVKEFLEENKWSGIVINDNGYSIDSVKNNEKCIALSVKDGGNIPFIFIISNEDDIYISYDENIQGLINTIHVKSDTYFMDIERF